MSYILTEDIYEAGYLMSHGIDCIAIEKAENGNNSYVFAETEKTIDLLAYYTTDHTRKFLTYSGSRISKTSYKPIFGVKLAGFLMSCGIPMSYLAVHDTKPNKMVYYFIQSLRFLEAMKEYDRLSCYRMEENWFANAIPIMI